MQQENVTTFPYILWGHLEAFFVFFGLQDSPSVYTNIQN